MSNCPRCGTPELSYGGGCPKCGRPAGYELPSPDTFFEEWGCLIVLLAFVGVICWAVIRMVL